MDGLVLLPVVRVTDDIQAIASDPELQRIPSTAECTRLSLSATGSRAGALGH